MVKPQLFIAIQYHQTVPSYLFLKNENKAQNFTTIYLLFHAFVSNQKTWPISQPLPTQVVSLRPSLCPASPYRSKRSTPSMMAGTLPVSSSFFFSSSLSSPWLPWLCSMSYLTVGAALRGKHTTSYKRKAQGAAASS